MPVWEPPASSLLDLAHTAPFRHYCRSRGIRFEPTGRGGEAERWTIALASLPPAVLARVDTELAQVFALADADGNAHLLAAGGDTLPADDVPYGGPLALWFLLHRPADFREVFFHHAGAGRPCWRCARGPAGLTPAELLGRAGNLRDALRAFFRRDGIGRFCVAEAYPVPDGVRFVVRVADRVRLVEGFTARGQPSLRPVRPAITLLFQYHPADGTVLLRSPLNGPERTEGLLRCFGRAVLGIEVAAEEDAFVLDRLKYPFHPPPDAPDMLLARVRAVHLRYPARLGRRLLKLETLADDDPDAVAQLLGAHAGDLDALTVTHAELQVRLLVDARPMDVPVRLWRDRSDLDRSPLGERLRRCLRRWGLCRG